MGHSGLLGARRRVLGFDSFSGMGKEGGREGGKEGREGGGRGRRREGRIG